MSVGESLVRDHLVAARVLNVLDPQQDHYRNTVTAEVADNGLEIIVAEARGPLHPNTATIMQQANQAAQAQFDAAMPAVRQRRRQIGHFLQLIEAVMNGPADQTAYAQIQQHLNALRGVGVVDASINYAAVRADNTRLRHDAMQLAGQGEQAASLVVQYLDEALKAETSNGRGAFGRFPPIGVETGVRDFFFIHNLLRGEGWGYILTESGLLLEEGGKHREAIDDLVAAEHVFGYKDPAVYLGLGKAYKASGGNSIDQAINAFNRVLEDAPADIEANTALMEIYRQKAVQTRRSVEPQIVHHDVLAEARQNLTSDSIESANISNSHKASQLYNLAVAYLTLDPQHVDEAIPLLQSSLALEPRKETYSWLAEAHSRIATGDLYTPPALPRHPAGPSLLGMTGRAVRAVMTTPVHLRTPVILGRR